MSGRWSYSLFSYDIVIISVVVVLSMMISLIPDPVFGLGRLPKKKVFLVNEEQYISSERTYNLEDFFWTGSGDGPLPPPDTIQNPIIKTTTIVATVFLDSPSTMTTETSSKEDCLTECPIGPADGEIDPTRVGDVESGSEVPLPDPRYWLLTVLRASATPLPPTISRSLAKLYQKAFTRQQEKHLGIVTVTPASLKRKHHPAKNHSINIDLISLSRQNVKPNEDERLDQTEDPLISTINTDDDIDNVTSSTEPPYEILPNFSTTTKNPRLRKKRSVQSIAQELNILLMRNYSFDDIKNFSNVLDVVKREVYGEAGQPRVEVFLYNLTKGNVSSGIDEIKIIYWVAVGGRPVPAKTAAHDMNLLADAEVVAELGYPITTKAEPYLKSPESLNGVLEASNMRDMWIIIVGAILAAIVLLSLVALLACRLINQRKFSAASRVLQSGKANVSDRKVIRNEDLIKGRKEQDNIAYLHEERDKKTIPTPARKTDERYVTQIGRYEPGKLQRISSASSSSSSGSSDSSKMTTTLRQRQRLFEQHMQNEYATVNKKNKLKHKKIRSKKVGIASEATEEVGSISRSYQDKFVLSSPSSYSSSSCDSVIIRRPEGVLSPTSYLSMPSVKSFPRGNAVEPLSRVLEPLSVRHLDMDSDSPGQASNSKPHDPRGKGFDNKSKSNKNEDRANENLVRLGSINKDPGVIGPVVWDMHRQKLEKEAQISDDVSSSGGKNISKMRQRFNELVDDAFSLFGSGSATPKSTVATTPLKLNNADVPSKSSEAKNNQRRHSAKDSFKSASTDSEKQFDRPQTALPPRPPLPRQNLNPTVAWTPNDNIQQRASSANTIRRPIIDVALVNSDAVLPADDPAVPLIQAIKKELEKLPGTSDA